MRQWKLWMMAAILTCGFLTTSCDDVVNALDNPTTQEEDVWNFEQLKIADSEFQPIEVSVAVLGSIGSSAEQQAAEYWFKNLTNQVTDETMVVITNKITEDNKADIAKVLERYGLLLLVEPTKENVEAYAHDMLLDPNAEFDNLELIGLSGFGDQFLSYKDEDDEASGDVVPTALSGDDIWEATPMEYLRLKAFAQWVEKVENKYTALQNQQAKAGTRGLTGKLNLASVSGTIERCVQLTSCPSFKSYHNNGRRDDWESCPLSVTCNYHIVPVYNFSEKADYYIISTDVSWDCSETLKGFKKIYHSGMFARDRRSLRFFPIECKFYSTPITANLSVTTPQPIIPQSAPQEKDVQLDESFSLNGEVSGGASAEIGLDGPSASANIDANLGFGAEQSKSEQFTTQQWTVGSYTSGTKLGHVIFIPDGYRPRLGGDDGIEIPSGPNYRQSIPVDEFWVWKVEGTKKNTFNSALTIQFTAEPTVGFYSYFFAVDGLDHNFSSKSMSKKITVPAPIRMDAGFLTIEVDNGLNVFEVKATDTKTKKVAALRKQTVKNGETISIGLLAGTDSGKKQYDIEIKMGETEATAKTYKSTSAQELDGSFQENKITTKLNFQLK